MEENEIKVTDQKFSVVRSIDIVALCKHLIQKISKEAAAFGYLFVITMVLLE